MMLLLRVMSLAHDGIATRDMRARYAGRDMKARYAVALVIMRGTVPRGPQQGGTAGGHSRGCRGVPHGKV